MIFEAQFYGNTWKTGDEAQFAKISEAEIPKPNVAEQGTHLPNHIIYEQGHMHIFFLREMQSKVKIEHIDIACSWSKREFMHKLLSQHARYI